MGLSMGLYSAFWMVDDWARVMDHDLAVSMVERKVVLSVQKKEYQME